MPPVRILDNMQLEPNDYTVKIKEVEAGKGRIFANQLMVMDPMGKEITLPGYHTTEPTFGLPATWIEPALRDEAELKGYSIIDPSTVISTHLTEVLKANVADLLELRQRAVAAQRPHQGPAEAGRGHRPEPDLGFGHPARAAGICSTERISIRDLPTILEGIAEIAGNGPHRPDDRRACALAPRAPDLRRQSRPRRQSAAAHPVAAVGARFRRSHGRRRRQNAISPWRRRACSSSSSSIQQGFENAAQMGELPVLITSPGIRPHVRAIIERFRPQTVVMSQNEVHPRIRLRTIGAV